MRYLCSNTYIKPRFVSGIQNMRRTWLKIRFKLIITTSYSFAKNICLKL